MGTSEAKVKHWFKKRLVDVLTDCQLSVDAAARVALEGDRRRAADGRRISGLRRRRRPPAEEDQRRGHQQARRQLRLQEVPQRRLQKSQGGE